MFLRNHIPGQLILVEGSEEGIWFLAASYSRDPKRTLCFYIYYLVQGHSFFFFFYFLVVGFFFFFFFVNGKTSCKVLVAQVGTGMGYPGRGGYVEPWGFPESQN